MLSTRHSRTRAYEGACSDPGEGSSPHGRRLRWNAFFSSERGFSLLELVIGSAVLVIAMGAVVSLLRVSQSLHSQTQEGLELEQNVRSALNFMCRELTNAGAGVPYLTSVSGSPQIVVPSGAYVGPLGNAVTGGFIYPITPGYRAGDIVTRDGEGNTLASSIRTDMLTFVTNTGNPGFVNQTSPGPSTDFGANVFVEDRNLFAVGQVVLISNGFSISLGQITRITSDGALQFANGSGTLLLNPAASSANPNPNMAAAQQLTGGPPPLVFPMATVTYFIDATTTPAHPSIKRLASSSGGRSGAEEVANDIEDLKVTYLVDSDANATTSAVEVTSPTTAQTPLIRGVTVSVTGRSHLKMGDTSNPDRHNRVTLSQTVFFRNNIRR